MILVGSMSMAIIGLETLAASTNGSKVARNRTMLEQNKVQPLANYPVVIKLPIQWGDQDAFGHVNNTVAFRWFESARFAYMEQSGVDPLLTASGLGPILASIRCDYRRQVKYPDNVQIGTKIKRLGSSSITFDHTVYGESEQAVVATGEAVVVVFDYSSNQPRRMSDDVRSAIGLIEGESASEQM